MSTTPTQPALSLYIWFERKGEGVCSECGEPLDDDAQTIVMRFDQSPAWLRFHQVCAWKRATFMFGELF